LKRINEWQEALEKIFSYQFYVRAYELDSFGHVNNAVYINYLEQARWEIVHQLGLLELLQEQKSFLVVVETTIKYVKELRMFDRCRVETKMFGRGFFIDFKQDIFDAQNEKVAKAKIKCLFLDENRRPVDIPEQVIPYLYECD
jgi:acyl-CoA thioester hydrolase